MPDDPDYPRTATPGPSLPPPVPPSPPSPAYGEAPVGGPAGSAAAETTLGLEPNILAGLAVLFPIVGGIVLLVLEKRSAFVRFWAMQSVVVFGAIFAFNVATWIIGFVFGHIPVLGKVVGILLFLAGIVIGLGVLVLYVIMLIQAFSGKTWEVPVLGKIARQLLTKLTV